MSKKVLISGASIAGPTLAFWLHRSGFDVTVVERNESLRLGGQNIDVKGPGKKIARMMGIEEAIRQAHTGERGVFVVNKFNNVRAAFPAGSGGLTSELEIIRGDLVEILYNCTKDDVSYRFGDSIADLSEGADGMTVTFASGKTENFSLVIAAEGVRSKARQLVFGDEVKMKYLHLYTAYLTIPRARTDSQWARWYNAPEGRLFIFRPDNQGTTRASFTFWSDDDIYHGLSTEERKNVLKEKLANAGWEAPRITQELDRNEDVYLDAISQVKAPRWSKGRFAMVGDTAYCPTPITGMGTSLAIIGAYVLAGELSRHVDHSQAFDAYEKLMRPYVEEIQSLPPLTPRLVYPKSRTGVVLLNRVAGLFTSKPVKTLLKLFVGNESEEEKARKDEEEGINLPDYPALHNNQTT